MLGYYDAVLGLIPLALATITGALTIVGLELTMAVALASLVAITLIGHAMFVRTPTDAGSTAESTQSTGFNPAD